MIERLNEGLTLREPEIALGRRKLKDSSNHIEKAIKN